MEIRFYYKISDKKNNLLIMILDLLFKTYYILNVKYSEILMHFFDFLKKNYCKISDNIKHALVSSIHINISNIT